VEPSDPAVCVVGDATDHLAGFEGHGHIDDRRVAQGADERFTDPSQLPTVPVTWAHAATSAAPNPAAMAGLKFRHTRSQ
jgi:hypothetical protein